MKAKIWTKIRMEDNIKSIKSLYEISIEIRNFEINQLIQRNNFFMLFQGVLLASILLASILQAENSRPTIEFIICFSGIAISFYQMQMASGAKFWQEWWEERVVHFEELICKEIDENGTSNSIELFTIEATEVKKIVSSRLSKSRAGFTNFLILGEFSVGRAPIKVSIVLLCTWFTLLMSTFNWSGIDLSNIVSGFPTYEIKNSK